MTVLIDKLKHINAEHSRKYRNEEDQVTRRWFRDEYQAGIFVTCCMDGRVNIAAACGLVAGIAQNYRSSKPWEWTNSFDRTLSEDLNYFINKGQQCLMLVNYHFSKSSKHLCCAGFNYDTDAAIKSNTDFLKQIEFVYGHKHSVVFPILLGLETDEESLIIHADHHDDVLRVADLASYDENYLKATLAHMFKNITPVMMKLLLKLIKGNIEHVAKIRTSHRPIVELDHNEWVLALGNGLDWFYRPNQAIIIGMYSYELVDVITKAAAIIENNLETGKISKEEGFVLLASSSFVEKDLFAKRRACLRAATIMKTASEIIKNHYPQLIAFMHPLTVVIDVDTKKFIEVKDVDLE